MVAVDTNILVYAHRADSDRHRVAYELVKKLATSPMPWAVPWHCIHEFYSTVTRLGRLRPPSTPEEALGQVDTWMRSPSVQVLSECKESYAVLRGLLMETSVRGPMVFDARIASVCLENGVTELYSADRDMSQFPGLKVTDPFR